MKILARAAILVVGIALISLLSAFPVMLLWNAVIPSIFGLKTISFLEALYLSLLCGFLFKGSSTSSRK